jgi:2-methylcitrate dehydratase PrpD
MTEAVPSGRAAARGLMSALMARHGYTASLRAIEAPRGIAQTYSMKNDWSEITSELGERFEISFNTYKPFACGIVIHPSIDGCVQLRNRHGLKAGDIASIELLFTRSCSSSPARRRRRTGWRASSASITRRPQE